ncbi:hypothetical protein ORI98_06210 [Shewanella sp. ULN5]|uniref:hypothetical protein n=1 Tax=Shewanella sp. ULN5 TaxID=2994678 RepID=UPI00273F1DA4|nr:hypothetical protein [Shewanella sp. ULN5]MDP5146028.1 hypothetical protein [Shewanella sp. ULN5]
MTLNTRHKKATTAATVMAGIKSKLIGIDMMKASLPVSNPFAQVIAAEANRVIRTLSLSQPADRTAVESVLESLKAIAEPTAPALAKTLHIRLVAVRNNIKVNQVEV